MNAQGSSNNNNSNYRQHRRSSFNDSSGGRSSNESADHGLRRSFVAIHRQNNNSPTSPAAVLMNPSSNNSNGGRSRRSSTTENTPRPRLLKKRSHRRHSMNMNSRRVSIETTHGDGQIQMPSLPFSKAETASSGNRTRQPPPPPPPRSRNNGGRRDSNEQQEGLAHPPSTHHQASSRRSFHNTNKAKDHKTSDHQVVRRRRSHEDEGRPTSHQGQGPSRRITISVAPSDEQLQQLRRPDTAYGHQQQYAQDHGGQEPFHKGFRPDYVLGEYSRHTSHMIMPQDDVHAIQLVNTLSKHDFAFVKRSNGNYSYAMAYRTSSYSNDDDDEKKDEGMAFVMDDSGSTKMIRKKHWCEYIRLVSVQDCSMITTPTEDQAMNNNDMDCGIEEMVHPSTHQQRTSPPTHQETQDVHNPSQDHHDSDEAVVLCQEIPMVCQEIPAPHPPQQHNPQASQVNSMGLRHNQDTASSGNRTRQPPPPPPPRSRNNGGRRDSNEQQEGLAHPPSTHHQASSRRSFHNTNKAKDHKTSDHQVVRRRRSHEDEGRPTSHQGQGPSRRITISVAPSDEQLQQLRRPDTAYGHQQQYAQDHGGQEPFHKGFRPDYVLGEYSRHTSHMIMPQDDVHAIQLVNTLSKHDFAFVKRSNGNYSYAMAYRTSSYSNDDDDEKKDEGMAFVMDDSGSTKMIRKKHWCEYIRLVSVQDCSMITTPTEDQAMNNNDMDCGIEEMVHPSTHQQRTSPPTHQETQDVHNPSQDHHDSDEAVVLCQEIPMVCQEIPAPHPPQQHNPQASQVNSMGLRHNQDNEEEENNNDDCTAPLPEMITVRPHENNEECSLISSVSERARRVWRFENARE